MRDDSGIAAGAATEFKGQEARAVITHQPIVLR